MALIFYDIPTRYYPGTRGTPKFVVPLFLCFLANYFLRIKPPVISEFFLIYPHSKSPDLWKTIFFSIHTNHPNLLLALSPRIPFFISSKFYSLSQWNVDILQGKHPEIDQPPEQTIIDWIRRTLSWKRTILMSFNCSCLLVFISLNCWSTKVLWKFSVVKFRRRFLRTPKDKIFISRGNSKR